MQVKCLTCAGGDVTLDPGREALRVRETKNGTERTVILGPTATPRSARGLRAARRARGRPSPADHKLVFLSNRGTPHFLRCGALPMGQVCQAAGLVDDAVLVAGLDGARVCGFDGADWGACG